MIYLGYSVTYMYMPRWLTLPVLYILEFCMDFLGSFAESRNSERKREIYLWFWRKKQYFLKSTGWRHLGNVNERAQVQIIWLVILGHMIYNGILLAE